MLQYEITGGTMTCIEIWRLVPRPTPLDATQKYVPSSFFVIFLNVKILPLKNR